MVKRQRTPHFITGLGDGYVRREKGNEKGSQQIVNHKLHTPAATDDLFHLAQHHRRNVNPNNQYRLRTPEKAVNERLARMNMEEGREAQRWDTMFTDASTDKAEISNPLRTAEQWQMSAFALVGMIVLLSAVFLHLVTDSSSSGGSSAHHHHHKYHSRVHGQRKSHGRAATLKKKTDEWDSDDEEEEYSDGDYAYWPEIEGQANPNASPNAPAASATTKKPAIFYPYHQPRHRKPSASGYKETFNGAAYSPGASTAATGYQSRSYYLNPSEGPKLPSYASPRPTTYEQTPTSNRRTPRSSFTDAASPAQPHRAMTAALENEFVAAGLESFDTATSTPLRQRQIVQPFSATTPKLVQDDDEESQHAMSDTHGSPSPANSPGAVNWQPSYTHDDGAYRAYGQMQQSLNALHGVNSSNMLQGTAYQHSNMQQQGNASLHHHRQQSFSSNHSSNSMQQHRLSVSSNHSGCLIPSGMDDMELEETPRAGLKRRTVDVSMAKTPKAVGGSAMAKQAYQAFNQVQQRNQQQIGRSSSGDASDPFYHLRLPSTSNMHVDQPFPRHLQEAQGSNFNLPLDLSHRQSYHQQQSIYGQGQLLPSSFRQENNQHDGQVPFIPKLDMAAAAEISQKQSLCSKNNAPRSMVIEELQLMKMESGSVPHWEVRNAYAGASANVAQHQQQNHQSHSSSSALSASESNDVYEAEEDDNPNDPRKSIKHKRDNLTTATNATASLQSSIEFSELNLIEVIGGGGFGQVWKAIWNGTPVAVKVLTGSAQAKHVSKAILEEFAAEINLLKGMRHPNICLYMGACVDPPNRAIITELAANGSLWDALRLPLSPPFSVADGVSRHTWPSKLYNPGIHGTPPSSAGVTLPPVPPNGSWPWELVKRVACGAARGMAYLHNGNPPILHRDLKSANILLNESYTPKVCDFGLSRLKAQERSMTGNCGTVQWMAPEVLANQSYNEKADVFSYGIICIELLTRECPYEGMSAIQCALAVLNRDYRPEIPRWCPPSLRALITSCIKKDQNDRPTFGQIIIALDDMP